MATAIVFDLFETLVSEFDVEYPTSRDTALELGLDPTAFQREYRKLQPRRYAGECGDYTAVVCRLASQLGENPDPERVASIHTRRERAFADYLSRPEPAILEMLRAIEAEGLKIGLISNTEGSEVAAWSTSPLARFFDATVFSHAVGHVKPDPEIYKIACVKLRIDPTECLYVGDGGSDELNGAAGMGMIPHCAAWFLQRHTSILGPDIVEERSKGYSTIYHPMELIPIIRGELSA